MREIRERLDVHRRDALVLLEEVTRTAKLHAGFRLAGAVGHLARAQALFAEELAGLSCGSEPQPAVAGSRGKAAPHDPEDATPVDGPMPKPRR